MDGFGGFPFLFVETGEGGGDFTLGGELLLLSPGACGFRGRQVTLEPLLVSGRTWTLFGMPLSQGVGAYFGSITCSDGPMLGTPHCLPWPAGECAGAQHLHPGSLPVHEGTQGG